MARKNKKHRIGVVYSTNPDYDYAYEDSQQETLPPQDQSLTISIDRKQRKGKEVTLITGFTGSAEDLKDLARALKKHCGTGGSAKDGEILIQGNFKEKAASYLKKQGYGRVKVK